jgi:hypothetical protein
VANEDCTAVSLPLHCSKVAHDRSLARGPMDVVRDCCDGVGSSKLRSLGKRVRAKNNWLGGSGQCPWWLFRRLVFHARSPDGRQRGEWSADDEEALCDGEIEPPDVTVTLEWAMSPAEANARVSARASDEAFEQSTCLRLGPFRTMRHMFFILQRRYR